MSNASHRHSHRQARVIPWGLILTGLTLLALTGALGALLASITAPVAQATTAYLQPAVSAARVASFTSHLTTVDSSGLGINPAAVAVPATGPIGAARVAAATVS